MLRSGAETYRVEDTVTRILSIHNFSRTDIFVTPTIITASVTNKGVPVTAIRRIKDRVNRLDKIELINQLSRDYVNKTYSTEQAKLRLREIDAIAPYSFWLIFWMSGISAGCFAAMFNGGVMEFIVCLVTGCFISYVQRVLSNRGVVRYLTLFIVSFCIGSIVMSILYFYPILSMDAMIIGCIMTLVPGVAFTNAIRDTIGDELISGMSRAVEALCIALVIAVGVSLPITIYLMLGGTL